MKNPISVNNALHRRLKALWRDRSGATAVEFVMVFMMVVFFTIATFEFGLAWYAYNRAEIGTQWGVRLAVESDPVKPVPAAFVDAIEPHVTRQVWGMIQVQQLTGMRPDEMTAMRGCDLNMTGGVREYVPKSHKTEHHGKDRMIFIGPKAQTVLRAFLKTDLQGFLFSPIDARREFDERQTASRQ